MQNKISINENILRNDELQKFHIIDIPEKII